MDIIAAHRHGLIEQLEEEVAALAGRPRDHGQRAVVLHHLYDHSRGSFDWALAEARRSLRIAMALERLDKRVKRWGWLVPKRGQASQALERLANAIGNASRLRCAAAYRAYRLSAVPSLRGEAEEDLPAELLSTLAECHAARRVGTEMPAQVRQQLGEQCEKMASAACDQEELEAAWAAIGATGLGRLARRLLSDRALDRLATRDRKRGWRRVEMELRADEMLPASFRSNPAQHFYGLQQTIAERRRQQWREACDREPDAFERAA